MSEICAAMGRKLTRARRQHKLSLQDVAEELCISLYYLKALESGHLGKLPGPVYALGFLRNYADLVGLNADELAGMAQDCLADEEAAQRPHLPEPHRESRFPARLVLVGATSAMLLFFTTWPMVGNQGDSEASGVPVLPDTQFYPQTVWISLWAESCREPLALRKQSLPQPAYFLGKKFNTLIYNTK